MDTADDTGPAWPEPHANADLIGHDAAEATLLDAWRSGRMAHAWLVTGPKGIGKATLAYRFARFALSREGKQPAGLFGEPPVSLAVPSDDPVFSCVAAEGHRDLVTVRRSWDERAKRLRGEIVVGDVQKLGRFFSMTAEGGDWRIAVIDSADEMNRHAANAVLKLLEEPPNKSLILLVCHSPGRLLPTIRSRCRRLPLRPLADEQVTQLLGHYLPDLPVDEREVLARLGEGSIGRALDLAESGGLELYRTLVNLLDASSPHVSDIHALGDRLARKEEVGHYRTFMDLLSWWLARLIRHRALNELPPELVPGESRIAAGIGRGRPLDQLVDLWEKMADLVERAESLNLSRKQVILNVFHALQQTR